MQHQPTDPTPETTPITNPTALLSSARARQLRAGIISFFVATLGMAALWLLLPDHAPLAAAQTINQEPNEATVIVQLDDQARVVRRIDFTAPISGLAALQQSGLAVVYSDTSFGPAVCAIEGVGCPASDCFCSSNFWGYNYWDGQAWQGYQVGAGSSTISQSGSIEGWRWGAFGDPLVSVSPTLAAATALDWLQARQVITDGGYGSAGASLEALLAVGANHIAASEWRRTPNSPSLATYLTLNAAEYTKAAAGAAGKSAVAFSGGEMCLPVGALTPQAFFSPTLGAYTDQSGPNSWAMLGAAAISESVPGIAIDVLRESALANGGWEWMPGWEADSNSTAMAIQALIAAGEPVTASSVLEGLAYLASIQNEDGGFSYAEGPTFASDVNSTSYAVQAIIGADQDPNRPEWTIAGRSPISYLLSMQLPDGSFEWQPGSGSNQLATLQAIPALLGQAYPTTVTTLAQCPALHIPSINKP